MKTATGVRGVVSYYKKNKNKHHEICSNYMLIGRVFLFQSTHAQSLYEELKQIKQSKEFEETKQELIQEILSSDADVLDEDQILACGYEK